MEKMTCGTCVRYRAHYARYGRRYLELDQGHCAYPRLKIRQWDAPACPHHKARPVAEEAQEATPNFVNA